MYFDNVFLVPVDVIIGHVITKVGAVIKVDKISCLQIWITYVKCKESYGIRLHLFFTHALIHLSNTASNILNVKPGGDLCQI